MKEQNYQSKITGIYTPAEAFGAISQVNKWWAKTFEGSAENLNDTFTVRFGETFVSFTVTESIPEKKIDWLLTDCYLPWLNNKTEWNSTTVQFEISQIAEQTQITMTHIGLVPEIECFEACQAGWNKHLNGSLLKLLTEHAGVPQ